MTMQAAIWARSLPIPSSIKFTLFAFGLRATPDNMTYPSVHQICIDTSQNRKTVEKNIKLLIQEKLMEDSGQRVGRSNQVIKYKLMVENNHPHIWGERNKIDHPQIYHRPPPNLDIDHPQIWGTENNKIIKENKSNIYISDNCTISENKNVDKSCLKTNHQDKSPIPNNFKPTEDHYRLAKKNGYAEPNGEVDAFMDFHIAKGTLSYDWNRSFNTWLRNGKKFIKPKRTSNTDKFWDSIPDSDYPDFNEEKAEECGGK